MTEYITTYTGRRIAPLDPKREDICLDDIAHALSLMTRANGHMPEFYSVGQHCIACAREAIARGHSPRVALAALVHDSSEAYISDITRPVKRQLDFYLEVEDRLQRMIYEFFLGSELSEAEFAQVDAIDNAMLYHEFLHYMKQELTPYKAEILTQPRFEVRPFAEVEQEFKELYTELHARLEAH
ncbi:phosphohydrolase [Porphyromonas sp. COT-239 OH1446]|uniref:phosphohydrolase n=1 Tax=Porphyromonas sp. COT-239 OH1446 TaxID=1515613 RepID=UPI00052D67BE|nr:phosphohydrolase [Porphyromonas sp. COT-239 OH1446]KGN68446.1 phosphohydrolase [Porphyromonas sp. COT-239 OH1446]